MTEPTKKEVLLYKPISIWLEEFLKNKFPKTKVSVYDVHARNLSDLLESIPEKKYFPEYSTYQIKVDLVGLVERNNKCELVFIEVKDTTLSLKDLSQLIGYSKIVRPIGSFLISPKTLGRPLRQLLKHFKRLDILEYCPGYFVRIGQWDMVRNSVLDGDFIPSFSHINKSL